MNNFRYVIIFEDESFEPHDIIGTEDDAREMFSEAWMRLHNGQKFDKTPVRMELIRMDGPMDESAFMAGYEIHLEGING